MIMVRKFIIVTIQTGLTIWGSWVLRICRKEALNGVRGEIRKVSRSRPAASMNHYRCVAFYDILIISISFEDYGYSTISPSGRTKIIAVVGENFSFTRIAYFRSK